MNSFRSKLITTLVAFGLIVSAIIGFGVLQFLPTFDMNWFVGIVLFFLIFEPIVISIVENSSRKKTQNQMVNIYMLTKVIRIIPALSFITIYALADGRETKSFVVIFILLYFLYLIVETLMFMRIEKHVKSLKNDE